VLASVRVSHACDITDEPIPMIAIGVWKTSAFRGLKLENLGPELLLVITFFSSWQLSCSRHQFDRNAPMRVFLMSLTIQCMYAGTYS
jgi:hypothetical protein